jgi:predicted Zn-dependent protease
MLLLLGAALAMSQKRRLDAPVSPDAVLSLVADTEHELTRLPAHFTHLSDADEIKLGDQLAKGYDGDYQAAMATPSAQAVQAYVSLVGGRLAAGAERKLPYRFHYIADPDLVNAFALPGGHVYIGAGLMALMDSEDELANVLGHEIAHIVHYDCVERIQTQAAIEKLPLGALVAIPVAVFEEGYSKTQELEADRDGTRVAVRAGYSPLGAVRLFQTYDRLYQARTHRAQNPEEELSTLAMQTLEGYFRSHPLPSERIAQIKQMISDEHWEDKVAEKPLAVEYVYLTAQAGRALAARNFAAAESAAARSLSLHQDQLDALSTLASAQFALMEFPAALESYRQLLQESPPNAAKVGEFANSLASGAVHTEHFDSAAKFARASLDLQPNNAPALTALAEAQMAMGDYEAAGTAYKQLANLYPDSAQQVVAYAGATARWALAQHRYRQALGTAGFWLTLQPHAQEALEIEADAELALGDFAGAAKVDRDLLDATPKDTPVRMDVVWNYADALSAAHQGETGAKEFLSFVQTARPVSTAALENQIRIELVGLLLMAGETAQPRQYAAQGRGVGGSRIPPETMDRLGWWYYRAGMYSEAQALLRRLAMQRPGDGSLQNDLAWAEMEQGDFDAAIPRFRAVAPTPDVRFEQWNAPQMGLAIALWRTHHADEALKNYEPAATADSRWANAALVGAFYSPAVSEAVGELEAERLKRPEARKKQGRAAR